MRAGRASKTAEQNALFRALENRRPAGERRVSDPLAEAFLRWPLRTVAWLGRTGVGRGAVMRIIDRRWPGVRTSLVARTRLIDEMVSEACAKTRQVVILGAGFDTRAWRLAALREADAVFEVDHPDTQRRTRAVVDRCRVRARNVRFVATDFQLDGVAAAMALKGYEPALATHFLWEGTTNYLDGATVDATLRWCATAAEGSELIFTYINRDLLTHPERYAGADRLAATLRRAGEQMTFGFDPADLEEYLCKRGLRMLSDTGAAEYRQSCYGDAARDMVGHEFYRVVHARVDGPRRAASGSRAHAVEARRA
jgi:methyltransferase (TIGR00027 family)